MASDRVTIVTVIRETLETTLRFVAWHRAMGADALRIYFDDPDDPAIPFLEPLEYVAVIRCAPAFWQSIGVADPGVWRVRQLAALTDGYRAVAEGWVAVLDGDELFWFDGRPFQEVLSGMAAEVRSIRVVTAELVFHRTTQGSITHFRGPVSLSQCTQIYGLAGFIIRRGNGMAGHRDGKSLTRAGLSLKRMRAHFAVPTRRSPGTDIVLTQADRAWLLHFVTLGFDHWRGRLERRLRGNGIGLRLKKAIVTAMDAPLDREQALRALFDTVHGIDDEQIARLQMASAYLGLDVDFDAPAKALFGPAAAG